MRNQLLYLILIIAFVSCTDEVKFNSPAFEGQKDNVFWRAVDSKAILETDGSMSIEGYTRNEKLTLKINSANPLQTYFLGTNGLNAVTYVLTDASGTITFSTGIGVGNGEITIEEYDAINKTITGTFKFNAKNVENNPLAGPLLNFKYGKFYKVPVINSSPTTVR